MMPGTHSAKRAIAVFAHNESTNVITCLESIAWQIRSDDEVYILDNGSTDGTDRLVDEFVSTHRAFRHVKIALGDKANAWNVFCHDLKPQADLYVFVDGDCTLGRKSLDQLGACLRDHPSASAASGVPNPCVSKRYSDLVGKHHGLVGNLYALSASLMDRIRHHGVRLPVGLVGDDSLLGALVRWDLQPQGDWECERVAVCNTAVFSYRRLSPCSLSDCRLYWRRKIRYSTRRIQLRLLKPHLKAHGLAGLPARITEVYQATSPELRLRWRGVDTWFDFLAIRNMKREARSPSR